MSLLEPNNEKMKAHIEKIRKETESKWEKSGLLEGLSGHIPDNIAMLLECCKSTKLNWVPE